jgi:hypothetical protein
MDSFHSCVLKKDHQAVRTNTQRSIRTCIKEELAVSSWNRCLSSSAFVSASEREVGGRRKGEREVGGRARERTKVEKGREEVEERRR